MQTYISSSTMATVQKLSEFKSGSLSSDEPEPSVCQESEQKKKSGSMRVQYLHQTEGGAVTNKRTTAVYRLKDKKKKNKHRENNNKAERK